MVLKGVSSSRVPDISMAREAGEGTSRETGGPGEVGSVGVSRHGVHCARWVCLEAFSPLPDRWVPSILQRFSLEQAGFLGIIQSSC